MAAIDPSQGIIVWKKEIVIVQRTKEQSESLSYAWAKGTKKKEYSSLSLELDQEKIDAEC